MAEHERARRLTYADYAALPDDGRRWQLLDGELIVTPSPVLLHQAVVSWLDRRLGAHVEAEGLGWVYVAPFDVILDDHTVVQPDLLFVARGREAIIETWVRGAPDLCVEILSAGTERIDRQRKMDLYARFGVLHYWIVDPALGLLEEHVLEEDGYGVRTVARRDDAFTPALFPGLTLRLADVKLPGRG